MLLHLTVLMRCIHVPETGHIVFHGHIPLHQVGAALENAQVFDLLASTLLGHVAYFALPKILAVVRIPALS